MAGRIEPQAVDAAASDTRSRLKIVARAPIAKRGVYAVGVREIVQAAGALAGDS